MKYQSHPFCYRTRDWGLPAVQPVTTDGGGNGVLSGAWRKDYRLHRRGAREAARRTRIEQLERELEAERVVIEGPTDPAEIAARQTRPRTSTAVCRRMTGP